MYICDVIDMSPCMVEVIHAQLVVGDTVFHTTVQVSVFSLKSFQYTPPPSGVTRTSIGGLQSRSGRTGRESELSRLGRHMYLTPGVHLLQFRDSISARYKSRVGRIR